MIESRIVITDRLRKEGRYEEAAVYRDEQRRKFKRDGMTRKEAVDASWVAMAEIFPPLQPAVPQETGNDAALVEAILARTSRQEPFVAEDVEWVYENLGEALLAAEAVPNLGAWSLWRWAKENLTQFFEGLWSKASKFAGESDKAEDSAYRGPSEQIREIEAMLGVNDWRWGQVTVGPSFFVDAVAEELEDVRREFAWETPLEEAVADLAMRVEQMARVQPKYA